VAGKIFPAEVHWAAGDLEADQHGAAVRRVPAVALRVGRVLARVAADGSSAEVHWAADQELARIDPEAVLRDAGPNRRKIGVADHDVAREDRSSSELAADSDGKPTPSLSRTGNNTTRPRSRDIRPRDTVRLARFLPVQEPLLLADRIGQPRSQGSKLPGLQSMQRFLEILSSFFPFRLHRYRGWRLL
jgi:hypothetical protein